ncbi:MBL fold metallo-hydrolase [Jiella flava]|uniref:MBL fold metallo-hydrolase n=1 Tax=Jiella flava TaxID=2816857 RepID=A0A939FXN5_9HYPH|nr:MBL fold metallo-hydrolase [Jiella flava]MBO0662111.1 MBL fold metallo-hydrolase [Jiella flava]
MVAALPDPITIVRRVGDIRLHTFISAFTQGNIANATHIVESENALVLVDGQFLAPYARQFRQYADRLGKPIDRIYLSHRHPDHWFGLASAFRDVPIYALQETIDFLTADGSTSLQDHWTMGTLAPDDIIIPQHVANAGDVDIDGVRYVLHKVTNTEIDFLLTLALPDYLVYIAQDLIYSGNHLYLTKYMNNWIGVLQDILHSDYEIFLPGHGFPTDKNGVADNIQYITVAMEAVGRGFSNEEFKKFMIGQFPEKKCPSIFNIYIPRLFDNASEF